MKRISLIILFLLSTSATLVAIRNSKVSGDEPLKTTELATRQQFWLWARFRKGAEPILRPGDIGEALSVCVGSGPAFDRCTTLRPSLQEAIATALTRPISAKNIGYCLWTGCDGAAHRAPINACLWLIVYGALDPADKTSMQTRDAACDGLDKDGKQAVEKNIEAWSKLFAAAQATQQPATR